MRSTLMLNDLRHAVRSLLKTPGFTAVALLTLALGIGLNTAIFSLINAALLSSLPVRNPQNLRIVNWVGDLKHLDDVSWAGKSTSPDAAGHRKYGSFTYAAYESMRDRGRGFSTLFALMPIDGATVWAQTGASATDGLLVSGNFFEGYGAKALLGRTLTRGDEQTGAAPVAVITHRLWEREFGLDPLVLGKTITINNVTCTIIGILPRDHVGPLLGDPSAFYVPLSWYSRLTSQSGFMAAINTWKVQIMGRLAPNADERQARASLELAFNQSLQTAGQQKAVGRLRIVLDDGHHGSLDRMLDQQQLAKPLLALMAGVGLLLLMACANLASLLLARAAARRHEFAVRAAMGANRWRLLRQPLFESLLLSLAGGIAGLLLAIGSRTVSQAFFAKRLHGDAYIDPVIDLRVLGFVFAVSVLLAVLFGAVPAVRAARADPLEGLKSLRQSGFSSLHFGKALVVIQVSVSVVLLVAAGLMVRTFANLSRIDPGIDPENVLIFRVTPRQVGYDSQKTLDFYDSVRRTVAAIPGVRAVAFSDVPPLGVGIAIATMISIPGGAEHQDVRMNTISDSFFSTMGMPLLQGRDFTPVDTEAAAKVAIVNETFSRRYFKSQGSIGQVFQDMDGDQPWTHRIIGVVRDSRSIDIRKEIRPVVYFPFRQYPEMGAELGMAFAVRSVLPPLSLVPAVRRSVAAIDPRVALTGIDTQRRLIDKLSSDERLLAIFGAMVGILAALLAGVGLFGLLAYLVAQRTGEIGIRMALGAQPTKVIRGIVGQSMRWVAAGVLAGVVMALWATQWLRSFLWGVEATDPLTIIAATVLLSLVAMAACFVPARRASKVDPLVALRAE